MKKAIINIMLLICTVAATAQEFKFNHGPYLQNMGSDEVTVYFTTNKEAFSWVEVTGDRWTKPQRFATVFAGQYDAYTKENRVRITGLRPGVKYRYRLISKEITKYKAYSIQYGDSIATSWEEFSTLNPNQKSFTFALTNDGHDKPEKVKELLNKVPLNNLDMVFYLGDMISYYEKEEAPYYAYIDPSVELFAKNKPFISIRGNHEMRGNLTRKYMSLIGCPNDRFYNIAYFGNTAIVMIDTGEDKPDTQPVYAGMNCYDDYRMEQIEWLKKEAATKRFKAAKNKIVLMHIPPMSVDDPNTPEEHAAKQLEKHFLPLFNKIGIDLTISGHTHRYVLAEKGERGNNFPMIANDNKSIMLVNCDKKGVNVKIVNQKDEVLLDRLFE